MEARAPTEPFSRSTVRASIPSFTTSAVRTANRWRAASPWDTAGNIFGSTFGGGANGLGTLFKIDTSGTFTSLHSFTCVDGCKPAGELLRDSSGTLYGTTVQGGPYNLGTVFKADSSGNVSLLYTFDVVVTDGNTPTASLVQDAAGNLYGTTSRRVVQ